MHGRYDQLRANLERLSTGELIDILRRRDREEWTPVVFDVVPSILMARGVSMQDMATLQAGQGAGDEGMTSAPSMVAMEFPNAAIAEGARLALESAGIATWASYGSVPGANVILRVRAEDEGKAREVLDAEAPPSDALPEDIAEPPCRRCGSRRVTPVTQIRDEDPMLSGGERYVREWLYECGACGHRWADEG
jgi:hypothetical protein